MRLRFASTPCWSRRTCGTVCRRHTEAFTLVEVILAISLAIGILVLALSFYHEASNLRRQLVVASEQVSTIRLIMDRLASDLRVARAHDWEGFNGDSTSLQFVKCEPLSQSAWTRPQPATDLRLVIYGVATGLDGTNQVVTGITRSERPALELRQKSASVTSTETSEVISTNVAPVEPLTDVVRYLNFRFWDGTAWVESWTDIVPPLAVEVSIGMEPSPDDASPGEYPFEVFRRVIALPSGQESDPFAELFAGDGLSSGVRTAEVRP